MRIAIVSVLTLVFATSSAADNTVQVKNLKTLCVVYRGDPASENHMDDAAVARAKKGVELGRLFYFRNSAARLNCELHWLVIDGAPPKSDGPTMDHIEADLKQRGVKPRQYDGVFVTGVGLAGNWGGFNILDGTAACFGGHGERGGLSWYPENDPGTAYGTAWNFAHEYQHAIDLVVAESSGRKDLLHAHPYSDRNEPFFKGYYDGGEHWDWIACTFREFDGWLDLKGVTNGRLECIDADGDGLPDDDPRLPMDEKRFGSDPSKKDTDGDGLSDLAEFTAGRYAGSDPTNADTDGDGLSDGDDAYPVVAIASEIPYRIARSNEWTPLIEKPFARGDTDGGPVAVAAKWDEKALYLRFSAKRRFAAHIKIDGSAANGFWEGGDTYLIRLAHDSIRFDGLGLRGPVPSANVSGHVDRGSGTFHLEATIPARIGQGVSKEINYGGRRQADDMVDGLTLVEGRSIAFNFALEFEGGMRVLMTPLHSMYAVRLAKPAGAPPVIVLRAPKATSDAAPLIEVLGVPAAGEVRIESDGRTVGARIGSGPVALTALNREGPLHIRAVMGEFKSAPAAITVDRSAAPPTSRIDGAKLIAECEPLADFELWWGLDGVPVGPLGGGRADKSGNLMLEIGDDSHNGWRVSGYDGSRFDKPVFVDSWPKIDRNFQGGRADQRLSADAFSLRFDSFLNIDKPGRYTFELSSDDGARLFLDGQLLINHWGHHGMSARTAAIQLSAGPHRLHIDYYELDGWAGIKLRYAPPGGELTADLPVRIVPVPSARIELFGVQTDRLGNRSAFAPVVR